MATITYITGPLVPGENFTINGSGFGRTSALKQVRIDGKRQVIVSWSDTQIVCTLTIGLLERLGIRLPLVIDRLLVPIADTQITIPVPDLESPDEPLIIDVTTVPRIKRQINEVRVRYWREVGATSKQYNTAQKQATNILKNRAT